VGTSLAIIIPTGFRSARAHAKRGAINFDVIWHLGPAVIVGVLAGIILTRAANGSLLKVVFAASAVIMAAKLLAGSDRWQLGATLPASPIGILTGLVIGLISSLMGVGGGVYVSSYMTLYGRPIHHAVATSSGFGPIIAIPATLGYVWAGWNMTGLPPGSFGYVSLAGAAIVIPVSVLAAPLGVYFAHGISRRKLEFGFAVFLMAMGTRFLLSLMGL
jgi:uncharacterized membrane protein YfcA